MVTSSVGRVTTVAGSTYGYQDGPAASARFGNPNALAFAPNGVLYVADSSNNKIRLIATDGTVSTLVTNGPPLSLSVPTGLTFDHLGNLIVADRDHGNVLKISPSGDVVTLASHLGMPSGVAVDANNNVFVAELSANRITKILPDQGTLVVAGSGVNGFADGTGSAAKFGSPRNLAFGPSGNLYVTDPDNGRIRKITPGGVVTTIAQGFTFAFGLAVGPDESVYAADFWGQKIMKITTDETKTVLAGSTSGYQDGTIAEALFSGPGGVAFGADNVIYVTDVFNNMVRAIDPNFGATPTTTTTTTTSTTSTTTTTTTTVAPTTTTTTTVAPTTTTTTTVAPTTTTTTTVAPTTTAAVAPTTTTATLTPTTTVSVTGAVPLAPISTVATTPPVATTSTVRPTPPPSEVVTTLPAPSSSPGAAIQGSTTTTTVAPKPEISVDTPTTGEGETVMVRGVDFEPGTTVDVEAHSTPIHLGSTTVRADGTFEYAAHLPLGLVGGHQIVAIGISSSGQSKTVSTPVTIVAAEPLAFTGFNPETALVALAAMALGLLALMVSRRSSAND